MDSQTEMLIARITHDLASPIGALSNAIEFMFDIENVQMDPTIRDLLEGSAQKLSSYLQLLRIALGKEYDPEAVSNEKIHQLIQDFYAHSGLTLQLSPEALEGTSSEKIRLLVLFILIIPKLLRPKGCIKVSIHKEEKLAIELLGSLFPKAETYISQLQKQNFSTESPETIFFTCLVDLQQQLSLIPNYHKQSEDKLRILI